MKRVGLVLSLVTAAMVFTLGSMGWAQQVPDFTKPNYAYSPPMRKFVNKLPGLGPSKANNLGQYIPIAAPDTTTYPGSDYYEIGLRETSQQMHSDLPPTKYRGYYQKNVAPAEQVSQYLGPLVIARKNVPVRFQFVNELNPASNLFLPVDKGEKGAGYGPRGPGAGYYSENRMSVHLHGGNPPWISDGLPHQWIAPVGETSVYKKGPDVYNVPDMPDPGQGAKTHYHPNDQSGRFMFFHDHAYGITRLNVYAGEAAGYLLVDPAEEDALKAAGVPGTIPSTGAPDLNHLIPLIIQDKTFVSDATCPYATDPARYTTATDPLWDTVAWGAGGSMWFPHVYQPNQTGTGAGVNPLGRWDYGPWMWPPIPNTEALPHPSLVPEAFHDTPVVNGTAYPYVVVQPRAYRFKILNAANDRFFNLQLYVASPNNKKEVKMVPANGKLYPNMNPQPGEAANLPVPFDGRAGGVPDPRNAGPVFHQLGNECGLMPALMTIPNTPVDFDYDRKSMTFGAIRNFPLPPDYPRNGYTLYLGPAERADVVIDFSQFAGQTLILYNDCPAPVPFFDPRYDFYSKGPDNTPVGGAPATKIGWGPNTRTIMQIRVTNGTPVPFDPTPLQAALPVMYAQYQDPPIVPLGMYGDNTLYGGLINQGINWDPFLWQGNTFAGYRIFQKSVSEDFDLKGRLNSRLGTEQSSIDTQGQQTLGMDYVQPPTEVFTENAMDPFGTQIWMVVHNGVDTHPIHFHLVNVQVVNRVDWAGIIKPPDANEMGWKEMVKMNPLESVVLAVRPKKAANVPFKVATSVRPLDSNVRPTGPLGSKYDAALNPNPLMSYDWQYVWHCHILGHEENDMMRPIVLVTKPFPPNQTQVTQPVPGTASVDYAFRDRSKNETGFVVQRATTPDFLTNLATFQVNASNGSATDMNGYINRKVTYTDGTVSLGNTYYYRVQALNQSGASPWSAVRSITVN